MGVALQHIHIENNPEAGRKLRNVFQELLVAYIVRRGRGVSHHIPRRIHVLALAQHVVLAQGHQCRVDKDLAGPTLEGAVSRITVELGEQVYKTVLQYIFRNIPVSHITETNGIHFAAQIVVD